MADLATLAIKIDNADVPKATASLNSLEVQSAKSEAATQRLTRRMALLEIEARKMDAEMQAAATANRYLTREMALAEIEARKLDAEMTKSATVTARLGSAMDKVGGAVFSVRGAMTALAGSLLLRELSTLADTYTNIQSRLRLVTTGTANLADVQAALFQQAQRTRTSFEGTTDLYVRLARNAAGLGASQEDLLRVTETINKAMVIGGGSAESNAAALVQLGQAFASGTLRGDELRSVLEQAPRLAEAIAKGLGVTIGQLREMGKEGKLTAAEVFTALRSQSGTIDAEFGRMQKTIGQGFQQVRNATLAAIGDFDKMTGASQAVASALGGLAQGISAISTHKEDLKAVGEALKAITLSLGGVATAYGIATLAAKSFAVQAVIGGAATAMEGLALAIGTVTTALTGASVAAGAFAVALGPVSLLAAAGALAIYDLNKAFDDYDDSVEEASKNTKEYVDYLKALGRAHAHGPEPAAAGAPPPAVDPEAAKKLAALRAERSLELRQLTEVNAAYGQSAQALAILNVQHDAERQKLQDSQTYSGKALAGLNALTDGMTRQKIAAIELAEARERANRVRDVQKSDADAVKQAQDALELAKLSDDAAAHRRIDLQAENDLAKARYDFAVATKDLDERRDAAAIRAAQTIYDSTVRRVEAVRQIGHETATITSETEKQKQAQEEATREIERRYRDLERTVSRSIEQGITDVTNGKNPFVALGQALKAAAIHALAEALAQKLTVTIAKVLGIEVPADKQVKAGRDMMSAADKQIEAANRMLRAAGLPVPQEQEKKKNVSLERFKEAFKVAGAAYGGYTLGHGIGESTGDKVTGAVGGAVSGAVAGAAIGGPVGAAVGGIAGFVGGIIGAGDAARKAAAALAAAKKSFDEAFDAAKAQANHDALAQQQAQIRAQGDELIRLYTAANVKLLALGLLNKKYLDEFAAGLEQVKAVTDQLLAQAAKAAAIQRQNEFADLEVRRLRAQGKDKEADALAFQNQQKRERDDFLASHAMSDPINRAEYQYLLQTQAMEAQKFATDQNTKALNDLTTTVRNAPTGFKVEPYIQEFAAAQPRPGMAPINVLPQPSGPLTPPGLPSVPPGLMATLARDPMRELALQMDRLSSVPSFTAPASEYPSSRVQPNVTTTNHFSITVNESKTPELTATVISQAIARKLDEVRAAANGPSMTRAQALERLPSLSTSSLRA